MLTQNKMGVIFLYIPPSLGQNCLASRLYTLLDEIQKIQKIAKTTLVVIYSGTGFEPTLIKPFLPLMSIDTTENLAFFTDAKNLEIEFDIHGQKKQIKTQTSQEVDIDKSESEKSKSLSWVGLVPKENYFFTKWRVIGALLLLFFVLIGALLYFRRKTSLKA